MMCFCCGGESVIRVGNVFIPGEGDYAVYKCSECGDIFRIPIYDVDEEIDVKTLDVNLTFRTLD